MSSDKPANENEISQEEIQKFIKEHIDEPEPGKNPDGTDIEGEEDE